MASRPLYELGTYGFPTKAPAPTRREPCRDVGLGHLDAHPAVADLCNDVGDCEDGFILNQPVPLEEDDAFWMKGLLR